MLNIFRSDFVILLFQHNYQNCHTVLLRCCLYLIPVPGNCANKEKSPSGTHTIEVEKQSKRSLEKSRSIATN